MLSDWHCRASKSNVQSFLAVRSIKSSLEDLLSVRGLVYLLAIVALLTILILGAGAGQIIF
jgi:hypothetical protein